MAEFNQANIINLIGEIVSIYEKDRECYAKIHYKDGFMDMKICTLMDVHLNDKIIINSKLNIQSVHTEIQKRV
ncbi:MAG: hypothetical protein Kow0098_24030 [Ignavibacteriaceae bacterium]